MHRRQPNATGPATAPPVRPAVFNSTSASARLPPPSCRGWWLRHFQQDRNAVASSPYRPAMRQMSDEVVSP
ncbi:hypothetical protein AB0O77_22815 [Streptomyces albidoflavus]|uniref:hypothetical protein n=1 Tax=Streptomyces albidoflavus TaxID=1886 RepID=UPI0034320C55